MAEGEDALRSGQLDLLGGEPRLEQSTDQLGREDCAEAETAWLSGLEDPDPGQPVLRSRGTPDSATSSSRERVLVTGTSFAQAWPG